MVGVQAALKVGVTVCLATGKARPAALEALTPVGLAGTPPWTAHSLTNTTLPKTH